MLEQTRNAVEGLKAAGLTRDEFSVRVQRIVKNGQFVGYGDVDITLYARTERQRALVPELAKYFKVVTFTKNGAPYGPVLVYPGKPRLSTEDVK